YNKALYISPFFDETLVTLAIVYYNQNMPDQAYETIRKCKTDCSIPNFRKILNLILKYKYGILLQKSGSSLNKKINEDKLQEKLFELYCISLSNNTDFEDESKKYLTTPGNLKKNKTP
ncbi:MAG: hypothetical protein HY738_15310, partial [Bacteroidia bacterium]|nr:hypothetical protein [Bacteroidia bacterium]